MSIGSNASIQAVPFGLDPDFVQVGVVAVAGADVTDLLVARVVQITSFALPEADLEDPPLPPGQDRLARRMLDDLQVRRRHAARQRVEPDQVAFLIGDHRPGRALALVGGEEEIAGRGAGLRRACEIRTVDGVSDGAER